MIISSYIRQLSVLPGVWWLVPDKEAAVEALRTYHEASHYADGRHRGSATVLGVEHLAPSLAIHVITTPSH